MDIRFANDKDIKTVYRLLCELKALELDYAKFEKVYINNVNDENVYYILAEDSGEAIGFISIHIQNLLHHLGKVAEIQELIVTDSARGKGVGKVLVDYVKGIAKDNDCVMLEVTTNVLRERAQNFYAKQDMKKSHCKFTFELE